MVSSKQNAEPNFGRVDSVDELGEIIRCFRKKQNITLEKISGLSNLSMRFISELERGKETAEIGKALKLLNKMGLEVHIQPRGYKQKVGVNDGG